MTLADADFGGHNNCDGALRFADIVADWFTGPEPCAALLLRCEGCGYEQTTPVECSLMHGARLFPPVGMIDFRATRPAQEGRFLVMGAGGFDNWQFAVSYERERAADLWMLTLQGIGQEHPGFRVAGQASRAGIHIRTSAPAELDPEREAASFANHVLNRVFTVKEEEAHG